MEQIAFLDKFVVGYGFKGIADYNTEISQTNFNDESELVDFVNKNMNNIKKLFKVSSLNLSRKQYKVDSVTLAFAILKNLLHQANIPFELVHKKSGNVMRLVQQNKLLVKYIENPMNDIIHSNSTPVEQLDFIDGKQYITELDLVEVDFNATMCTGLVSDTPKGQGHYIVPSFEKVITMMISLESKKTHIVFDTKEIVNMLHTGSSKTGEPLSNNVNLFLTEDTIDIDVPIMQCVSDIIYDINVRIANKGVIINAIPTKTELRVNDILLDLARIHKSDPLYLILLRFYGVYVRLSFKKTDQVIKSVLNKDITFIVGYKSVTLEQHERRKLLACKRAEFCGITVNEKSKVKTVQLTIDSDKKKHKIIKNQKNTDCTLHRSKLVLGNNITFDERSCIIKNIKVGVVNLADFGAEQNKISYIELKIGDGPDPVHTQRGSVHDNSAIDLAIDPIPAYALIYNQIELCFMTYGKLDPDTVIKVDYDMEITTDDQYEHPLNNIKFMTGVVSEGVFVKRYVSDKGVVTQKIEEVQLKISNKKSVRKAVKTLSLKDKANTSV